MSESQLSQPASSGRPSVCRNCGALIGGNETSCAVCNAPRAGEQAPRHPVYDRETIRFATAILTRRAPFTILFLVANIFVFLLTLLSSGGENSPLFNPTLVAYGAKTNALINAGEWWRFVTPVFLHGGLIHLFMNMLGLWLLGPHVERLYGSAKFVFFWVATGVAGVVGSYLTARPGMQLNTVSRFLFKDGDPTSVGASGALFGLIGVLFVFGIKFRNELPGAFKRAFGTGMLPTILLNVFIGFTIPVIDNAAHMGGLLAGALLALMVGYKRPGEPARVAHFWHVLQIISLLLVVVSFIMVARNYKGPPPELSNISSRTLLNAGRSDVPAFRDALNNGQKAFNEAINDKLEANEFERAVVALDGAPRFDEKGAALLDELKALIVRAQELSQIPANKRAGLRARERKAETREDFKAWLSKFSQWVKNDGEKYGIKLVDEEPSTENSGGKEQNQKPQNQK